tara:strand:+ start:2515 stop:2712 length:198 start_codon:yes stop_codon:yes gene_type:complete
MAQSMRRLLDKAAYVSDVLASNKVVPRIDKQLCNKSQVEKVSPNNMIPVPVLPEIAIVVVIGIDR